LSKGHLALAAQVRIRARQSYYPTPDKARLSA
jgi:hypothetical protein